LDELRARIAQDNALDVELYAFAESVLRRHGHAALTPPIA